MQKLIETAENNNKEYAVISITKPVIIKSDAWSLLGDKEFISRTTADNIVQAQLKFSEPSKLTKDVKGSAYVQGDIVESRKAFFEKWFSNQIRIVHLDQEEAFEQPVEVAAKVDLSGMDINNLHFYNYDKKTNVYKIIDNPAYRVDVNGYIHFTTQLGGTVIISENLLEKR